MFLLLRIVAPYIAVLIFWVWLENGLLAILAYHAQIIFWMGRHEMSIFFAPIRKTKVLLIPALFTGFVSYFLLPNLIQIPIGEWLSDYGISKHLLLFMIPYFGIMHPLLEQAHWQRIHRETHFGHLFFGLYHGIVLYSLMPPLYTALAVLALTGVSVLWAYMAKKESALISPTLFHIFADLGIILAAYFHA